MLLRPWMLPTPPRRLAAAVAIGAMAVAWTFAPAARAENTAGRAKVLFDQGRQLAKQGRYDEACPKLVQSFQLVPGVGTEFQLADCWEHVGETERARTLFLDVAQKSREAGQTERAALASVRAAALAPRTAEAAPKVEKLPEVVIHEPPTEKERAPKPAESSEATADPTLLPVALRDEYSKLAEAASKLAQLRQAVASLPRSPANDVRARALTQQLLALEHELDASWRLASNVAAAALRKADWAARQAKQAAAKRASVSSSLPTPRPATRASQLVSARAAKR